MRLFGAETVDLEQAIWGQRERLVRLCGHFTGQADVAEDLAHEALIEARRHLHNLRNPTALQAWLNGVTRNVCLRWMRHAGRESHFRFTPPPDDANPTDPIDAIADQFDLEIELERNELAELLDRALGALPPATRSVLIQKYIEESPHADIAARLGLSEGAVAMRLQRGKLALRKLLLTEFRAEAQTYGFADAADVWHETRMWCPGCGTHKLLGRLDPPYFAMRCPNCCTHPRLYTVLFNDHANVLGEVKGFRRAFSRYLSWNGDFYFQGIARREVICPRCGTDSPLRLEMPQEVAALFGMRGVDAMCPKCREPRNQVLHGLALSLPAGQRFWRDHQQIRSLPIAETTVANSPALVVGFETPNGDEQLEVLFNRATYEVVDISASRAMALR